MEYLIYSKLWFFLVELYHTFVARKDYKARVCEDQMDSPLIQCGY